MIAIAMCLITECTNTANAVLIEQNDLIPSTTLTADPDFPLEEINDGVTNDISPYNGFVATESSGTIRFDLARVYTLESFLLWNDINLTGEGIKDFRLEFFDASDALITPGFSTNYTAPLQQLAAAEYVFGSVVLGVSRVDLVVLNSYQGPIIKRIEIREVAFTGTMSTNPDRPVVPEPSTFSLSLFGMSLLMLISRRRHVRSAVKSTSSSGVS